MEQCFSSIFGIFHLPITNPVLVFSILLFIILLAPIILRKIKIPGIIGLIISGILIGPHGFGLLSNNASIELFSTIGLLYIMFLAGLDLDMNTFKITKHKSFLFGFFTFTIPLLIGFPVCHYLLGLNINASFLTASMFSTHTLVSYPIVSKFRITKNPAVAVTVGGTIITDTLVLIILAVMIDMSTNGALNIDFFIRLGISLLIFTIIMFWLIPRIARYFFQKLESEKQSHYIFVLSVMFFSAFLANITGLEPIIGAFAAGLALNKLIPHSSSLMNRIEFIGNTLFIPFFLISVGMILDLSVLANGYAAIMIAFSLSVVALSGKWLAAFFTQLVFRYSKFQRRLIFGLSSSHAAATLAIILAGYQAHILDKNILNGTIILILITCIISSFVTEVAAKKIVSEANNEEENGVAVIPNKEQLLLPISKISNIQALLDFGILIRNPKSPNPISILSVIPQDNQTESNILKTKTELDRFVQQGASADVPVHLITSIDHNISGGITRVSQEIMADSLIIGWTEKSGGLIDLLLETNMKKIIRNIEKNIFICRFKYQLIQSKRIVLLTPPFAEQESGFHYWVLKLIKLSKELSIQIDHFGDTKTNLRIQNLFKNYYSIRHIHFHLFEDWHNYSLLFNDIQEKDLIVVVASRNGFASYLSVFDEMVEKITKKYLNNNVIAIYPHQIHGYRAEVYQDISGEPIVKSINLFSKIKKEIKKRFRSKYSK